jgi:hypothetical protein
LQPQPLVIRGIVASAPLYVEAVKSEFVRYQEDAEWDLAQDPVTAWEEAMKKAVANRS